MNMFLKLAAYTAIAGVTMAIPVEQADAQRFRGAAKVKTPKKPSNFRAIKAAMRPFKTRGKRAYNNLKAAYRSEARNRQVKLQAEANYNAARDRYRANRTVGNQQAMNTSYNNYVDRKRQHDNALNVWRSAKDQVEFITGQRNSALNEGRSRTGQQVRPVRRGQPRVNPQRRVANQRTGASMVQFPRQIFNGGPMVVRDPVAILAAPVNARGPQPTGQQGNRPNAILSNPGAYQQLALRPAQGAGQPQFGNINAGQNPYAPAPQNFGIYAGMPVASAQNTFNPGRIRQAYNESSLSNLD